MIESYNAFISYRHVERDIRVAEDIQNQLEHYKIPKAITEKTGVRKIERIFRDKSELPITSNLTDDIQSALRNSEFLIVICSPEMLESLWCRREIELFLETHPHERILTVLSAGDPQTAIPDLLLTKEIHTTDSDGNPVVIKEQVEPLSCDYRLPLKRARREELPRLAAALIGCSYDELVQRANQYRLRKWRITAAAVGTASAAAVSYLIWSNMQIQKNLEQSQKNMSLYLAEESQDALANQDRIRAIQLALQALPSEGDDKPVIAEAEFALAEAAGVYKLPEALDYSAVRRFETDYVIHDFLISPDRTCMAAIDNENNLYLWNLPDDQPVYKEKMIDYANLYDSGEKGFYVSADNHTFLLDWTDGRVIWENTDPCQYQSLGVRKDSSLISKWTNKNLTVIDEDGKTIDTLSIPEVQTSYHLDNAVLDSSGKKALLSFVNWDQSFVMSADLETEETVILKDDLGFTDYMAYLDDGTAVICEMTNKMSEITEPSIYGDFYSIYRMTANIYRIDTGTHDVIWKTTVPFYQDGYYRSFEQMNFTAEDGSVHQGLLCNTSNVQTVIDLEDGSIFKKTEYPSLIKNIITVNNNSIYSLLADGSLGVNNLEDNYSSGIGAFVTDAKKALLAGRNEGQMADVMVLPEGKPYIIQYKPGVVPPEYRCLENIFKTRFYSAVIQNGKIALDYRDGSNDRHISVFDEETQQMLADYPVDLSDQIHYDFTKDGNTFRLINDRHLKITEVRLDSGEETVSYVIPEEVLLFDSLFEVNGGRVCYVYQSYTDEDRPVVMGVYDLAGKAVISQEIISHEGWSEGLSFEKCVFSRDGRYCLLEAYNYSKDSEKNELYYLRTDGKSPQAVKLNASDEDFYPGIINSSSTGFALIDNGEIHIYDMNANETGMIPFKTDSFLSAAYLGDELYLLTNEEKVYRYSPKNELLCTFDAGIYSNSGYSKNSVYTWQKVGSTIYLNADGVLNIFDTEEEGTRAFIPGILGFSQAEQRAVVRDTSKGFTGYAVGIMPVYSTEELIEIGNSIVQDYTIAEP